MSDPDLTLYVKEGCHLCEEARAMLALQGLYPRSVDITTDPQLYRRYHLRIPVLGSGGAELDWPFGPPDVCRVLERGGSR